MGEEQIIGATSTLMSYGALGVVAVYFMVKDWTVSKATTDAIERFTVAIEKLCIRVQAINE